VTRRAYSDAYERYAADWAGVPTAARNAFQRWWNRAFETPGSPRGGPDPWFPPRAVAMALPDCSLRRIPGIGAKGVRAIKRVSDVA
jgi:hypothetical protein